MLALLGIPDPWVWLVYVLSMMSAASCVAYGLRNTSRHDDSEQVEDRTWAVGQHQIEEEL